MPTVTTTAGFRGLVFFRPRIHQRRITAPLATGRGPVFYWGYRDCMGKETTKKARMRRPGSDGVR